MVKPESLLLVLLSSSGLELGLLEDAEAGPIRGSENTSGERARASLFPDVLLRVRRGWDWLETDALMPPPSSSLETRIKSSALPLSACPGASEEACEVQSEVQGVREDTRKMGELSGGPEYSTKNRATSPHALPWKDACSACFQAQVFPSGARPASWKLHAGFPGEQRKPPA